MFKLARTLRRAAVLAGLAACAAPALAQIEVAGGHVYPATIEVGGSVLRLNGAGYRAVAWFKGYAAALYIERKATTPAEVLAQTGAKRIQMKMLVDVPAVEFVKAFGKGVARNTPAAELPILEERMRRFDEMVAALGEVKKGDLVDLDFVPTRGLVFVVNGAPRGAPIPGADLYAALLRIFIGQRPVDKEMKIGLLGGPVG